ncbi:hypothetical protein PFICI_13222 [Pestalotiopsis fici W106-1]|uniref:Xylanolytic transcriptional activator regulatory domain-containing protein n=1 Tax=Pestalotiopsis fici (strain W106-1 / CGMCC3.15140) TaxID=1229662 RepID=W3WLL9_PESFW|nr:uncharacterized protein PFICI_13222 [Pestalotiopsis fici W106-1]ETS74738.1 hypothetical protein PFICI_13222 [Pestalotiopsis fici W106-1]
MSTCPLIRLLALQIQCSVGDEKSACDWCSEHNLACTYTRETQVKKKRNRAKLRDVQELLKRVEQLESTVANSRSDSQASVQCDQNASFDIVATPVPLIQSGFSGSSRGLSDELTAVQRSTPSFPSTPINSPLVPAHNSTVECSLGQNWYCMGLPLLSDRGEQWIQSKTGQDFTFSMLRLFKCYPSILESSLPSRVPNEELWRLPAEKTVQEMAAAFFKSSLHSAFPILDENSFQMVLGRAYEQTQNASSRSGSFPPSESAARVFVMAALALMGCGDEMVRRMYAAKVQSLLGYVTEQPSLIGLQTVLMLQRFYWSNERNSSVNVLHSIACRMVCALGGHVCLPCPSGSSLAWDHDGPLLRRLFWLCYMSDKDVSLRSGQPPLLTEEHCDLTPPACFSAQSQGSYGNETQIALLSFSPHRLNLCFLKERVYRELFSYRASKLADAAVLLCIRQLDDAIEVWRSSITMELRPKLSITTRVAAPTMLPGSAEDTLRVYLQLEYHYMMTVVHTTVRRCGADSIVSGNIPDDLHSAIHSSCDISLEASRSTLDYIANSAAVLAKENATHIGFYTSVAALSLFSDMLSHPRSPRSSVWIEHLDTATRLLRSLLGPCFSERTEDQINDAVDLLQELNRLGRCAVAKAREDVQ